MGEQVRVIAVDGVLLYVKQTQEGAPVEYRGRRSRRVRTIRIRREWEVSLAWIDTAADLTARPGETVGRISYDLRDRETRSKGRTYVNDRWQSPAWRYYVPGRSHRGMEEPSMKGCLERLVFFHQKPEAR